MISKSDSGYSGQFSYLQTDTNTNQRLDLNSIYSYRIFNEYKTLELVHGNQNISNFNISLNNNISGINLRNSVNSYICIYSEGNKSTISKSNIILNSTTIYG